MNSSKNILNRKFDANSPVLTATTGMYLIKKKIFHKRQRLISEKYNLIETTQKSGQENLDRSTHAHSVIGFTRAPLVYSKYSKLNR